MSPPEQQIHAKISGPIVMIGFGSIGKGTLPLIERHFDYDKSRFVIIDPHEDGEIARQHGVRFIKQAITRDNYREALLDIARDTNTPFNEPKSREGWGQLAHKLGVKGIHIAERDTQRSKKLKPMNVFVNTWSVEGFVSEGMQPAELGWGTHEKWMPDNGRTHEYGCGAAIYLLQPGANTRVRSWCPTPGAQYGFLVTHNESISIADYFTMRNGERVVYRPTCHYAYHPPSNAVLSLHEMFGATGKMQPKWRILDENEIEDGIDELGVLLYGHGKNAYWYGSQLSIEETRQIAPYQNATGMQVSSAVLARIVWALEKPTAGNLEADEMDFHRCLAILI